MVDYMRGYLYEKRSQTSPRFLDSAIASYQKVLKNYPDHLIANISMARAMNRKGDHLQAYRNLLSLRSRMSVSDEISLLKINEAILGLFDENNFDEAVLFKECQNMIDLGYQYPASRLMKVTVNNSFGQDEPLAIKGLLWWVDMLGESGSIDYEDVSDFSSNWNHPAINELRGLVKDVSTVKNIRWWRATSSGRRQPYLAMSKALAGMAQRFALQDSIKNADILYEKAFYVVTGGKNYGILTGSDVPDEFFQIASDWGIFLTKYARQVDPDGYKFRELEDFLFSGKGDAYLDSDDARIAKFHRTLGLIYVERGQWTGGGAKNATFQLERAISKAPEGVNTAVLSKIYADHLFQEGDENGAATRYAEATSSYVNSNDYRSAGKLLTQVKTSQNELYRGYMENLSSRKIEGEKALAFYNNSLYVYPNDLTLQKSRITTLIGLNKLDEASLELEKVIAAEPDSEDLYYTLGTIYHHKGENNKALGAYKKALEIDPDHFESNYNYAVILFNEASEIRREQNALGTTAREKRRAGAMEKLIEQKLRRALPQWEKAMELRPDNKEIQEALRFIYSKLKMEKALERMENRAFEH